MSSEEIKEIREKPVIDHDVTVDEKDLAQHNSDSSLEDDSKPILLNGEPVITTGHDVSRFVVDIRDDEDTALTFRSIFLGTLFAGLSAALSQVSKIKILQQFCMVQVYKTISGRYTCSSPCRWESPPSS
jgi:hypothetical protein